MMEINNLKINFIENGNLNLKDSIFYKLIKELYNKQELKKCINLIEYLNNKERCWGIVREGAYNLINNFNNNIIKKILKNKEMPLGDIYVYKFGEDYYVLEGHHRLCLILISGCKNYKINIMDNNEYPWVYSNIKEPNSLNRLKEDVNKIYNKKVAYNKIELPEFKDYHFMRSDDTRQKYLKENTKSSKRILDLGCHAGYNIFSMWDPNKFFIGVEIDKNALNVGKRLSFIYNKPTYFINEDICEFTKNLVKKNRNMGYLENIDTVLCLSVLHHIYLKDKSLFEETLKNIGKICNKFIFDIAQPNDNTVFPDKIKGVFTDNFILNDVKKILGFSKSGIIGRDEHFKRNLFMFTK